MKIDFEDYLRDVHMANYIGSDDNSPDAFDNWLSNLSSSEWIALGNKFGGMIVLSKPH